MGKRIRSALPWLLVLVIVIVVVVNRRLAPVPVGSHVVSEGTVVEVVFGRGTVEGKREAGLGFDLIGTVSDVLVDEGDRVSLGQELARLRPEKYDAELQTASLSLAEARAALGRLAAEETRAREALSLAEREQQRLRQLVEAKVSPSRDLDLAVDEVRLARADLDRVLASRGEATRGIAVAQATTAERRVTSLRATLLAPFDGLIVRRLRDPGDTVAIGTTILRVVDVHDLLLRTWIDETALTKLSVGQSVEVVFPGEPEKRYAGRLVLIGFESDRQTHELLVDIELLDRPSRIVTGQRADAWIEVGRREQAVTIPLSFLRHDDDGTFCWVDRNGRIERQELTIDVHGSDGVAVSEGLEAGDTVLTPPLNARASVAGRRWKDAP